MPLIGRIGISMPYADAAKRNAHYRAKYAEKYSDLAFRQKEAKRKADYHKKNLAVRRKAIREGVARYRAKRKAEEKA